MNSVNNGVIRQSHQVCPGCTTPKVFKGVEGFRGTESFKGLKTLNQDTVSFNGALQSMSNALNTKGGKLGIAGATLLLMLGIFAPRAKAHVITDMNGTPLKHVHQADQRIGFYFDSHGNWGVRSYGGGTRLDPGMQEYEKVFKHGHFKGIRPITRVYDEYNNQKAIQRGPIIRPNRMHKVFPHNTPPWVRDMIVTTPHSHTIIIPNCRICD